MADNQAGPLVPSFSGLPSESLDEYEWEVKAYVAGTNPRTDLFSGLASLGAWEAFRVRWRDALWTSRRSQRPRGRLAS